MKFYRDAADLPYMVEYRKPGTMAPRPVRFNREDGVYREITRLRRQGYHVRYLIYKPLKGEYVFEEEYEPLAPLARKVRL